MIRFLRSMITLTSRERPNIEFNRCAHRKNTVESGSKTAKQDETTEWFENLEGPKKPSSNYFQDATVEEKKEIIRRSWKELKNESRAPDVLSDEMVDSMAAELLSVRQLHRRLE